MPSLRGGMRIPRPESQRGAVLQKSDEEDRTILRPTPEGLLARTTPSSAPPAPESRRGVVRRVERTSDAGDPPSAVITAKTRISRPPSRKSVAAALVTVGAFVGLVTAAIVRGDADGLLDATAGLVQPAHAAAAQPAAAAAAVAPLPEVTVLPVTTLKAPPLGTDQNPAPGACLTGNDAPAAAAAPAAPATPGPTPPAPSPPARSSASPRSAPAEAVAVRARPSSSHSASRAASSSAGASSAAASNGGGAAHSAKAAKATPSSPEYESAAAADALAKAQLDTSLR